MSFMRQGQAACCGGCCEESADKSVKNLSNTADTALDAAGDRQLVFIAVDSGAEGTKKTLTQKAKKAAKYGAGATLLGTAAYSGIDAAASGKNFNETFEKNLSTVVGGGAKTLKVVGTAVATPVVSGVAGGLSKGLGITGMFSGVNSSMLMIIAVIFVLYMIMSGDSQQST